MGMAFGVFGAGIEYCRSTGRITLTLHGIRKDMMMKSSIFMGTMLHR